MTTDWMEHLGGRFIVFDGPDGSGKSSQFRRFADSVRAKGVRVCEVREPGGTAIGERTRDLLLDPAHTEMDVRCEMLLYMASRAQLVEERVRPALDRGELVLADRFVSSTFAYQGTAGGMALAEIESTARIACGRTWPDWWVIFDVDERTAAQRLNPLLDRMEQKGIAFHRRVRAGFLEQAEAHPDSFLVIDASASEDAVYSDLIAQLGRRERARQPR
ncbi:MAG: dTMP kinase [Planctomycetota bacterium]